MSTFTMSLSEVIEIHGRNGIGLESYPVIDESYRERLNAKIVDQYLNREIGQEIVSLWRHAMRRKMAQIMPMYNKLYATETLIIDPMRTVDIKTLSTSTTNSKADTTTVEDVKTDQTVTATTGSKSRNVNSDTPQVFLSDDGNYATSAVDNRADGTSTGTTADKRDGSSTTNAENNGTDVMDSSTTGFQGNQADMLMQYRATILNIDMLIVDELESLFMGIWNNGDTYTNRRR